MGQLDMAFGFDPDQSKTRASSNLLAARTIAQTLSGQGHRFLEATPEPDHSVGLPAYERQALGPKREPEGEEASSIQAGLPIEAR